MKTRKLLIALLIVALLVVYYLLGTDYLKQRNQQAALTPQVSDIIQSLAQIPVPARDLEQRLTAAQANLAAEKSMLPCRLNSTQVINTILRLAGECQVKAIPLVTQPWSVEKIGKHDYNVFRLNIAVEGSFSDLVSFTGKLENGELRTLIVDNLNVTRTS